tara:strand:- start:17 stop:376 length:360 start_codon:yes stop_codon:yes gene_type:complete
MNTLKNYIKKPYAKINQKTSNNEKISNDENIYMYYGEPNSSLPKEGWFQSCIICDIITHYTMFFKSIKISNKKSVNVNCYLCKRCNKAIHKNETYKEKFIKRCDELMIIYKDELIEFLM